MSDAAQTRELRARRLMALSGLVVIGAISMLVGDHVASLIRAPEERNAIERLEAAAKLDDEIAEPLHVERERQTLLSIGRRDRGRALGWVLLVAGGLFLAAGRWHASLQDDPQPEFERLVADRLPLPPPPPAGEMRAAADLDEPDAVPFVDELVARHGRSREAAIPILQAVQQRYSYLPDDVLRRICEVTEITPAQVDGTSSFYAQFRRSPVGRNVVRVCHGTACHVAGAERITDELRRHLGIAPDQDTDADREFTLDAVACLGCCSLAPVMMVEDETVGRLSPSSARQALESRRGGEA